MKLRRAMLLLAAMLLGVVVTCDALAARSGNRSGGQSAGHRGSQSGHTGHSGRFRHRTRVFIGVPLFAPLYFYPPLLPYYYYPPAPPAPVYFQQGPPLTTPQPGYWYYCPGSSAYYPAVTECPDGWQQVAPQPPS